MDILILFYADLLTPRGKQPPKKDQKRARRRDCSLGRHVDRAISEGLIFVLPSLKAIVSIDGLDLDDEGTRHILCERCPRLSVFRMTLLWCCDLCVDLIEHPFDRDRQHPHDERYRP